MQDFAGYAEAVRELLETGRGAEIGPWLDRNFDRRQSISTLNPKDVEMIERSRAVGAHCKYAGSGGAIIGTYPDEATYDRLIETFENSNVIVLKPRILP